MFLLFICTGNTCRSVMAEALMRREIAGDPDLDLTVGSAGLSVLAGNKASGQVLGLLKQEGIDVSGHRAAPVNPGLISQADLILVMTDAHPESLLKCYPDAKEKTFVLKRLAEFNDNLDILDPFGGSIEIYRHVLEEIRDSITKIASIIKRERSISQGGSKHEGGSGK